MESKTELVSKVIEGRGVQNKLSQPIKQLNAITMIGVSIGRESISLFILLY